MTKILLSQSVSVPDDVMQVDLDTERVLLNVTAETYYGLNDMAARMLEVLAAEASIGAAKGVLLLEYDASPETVEHELLRLIRELLDQGLVALR